MILVTLTMVGDVAAGRIMNDAWENDAWAWPRHDDDGDDDDDDDDDEDDGDHVDDDDDSSENI